MLAGAGTGVGPQLQTFACLVPALDTPPRAAYGNFTAHAVGTVRVAVMAAAVVINGYAVGGRLSGLCCIYWPSMPAGDHENSCCPYGLTVTIGFIDAPIG